MQNEDMIVQKKAVLNLLKSPQIITSPIIQRPPDAWGEEQLKDLIDEFIRISETNEEGNLDSIYVLLKENNGDLDTLSLFDGQQRLTNITLLLCAILKYTQEYEKAIPHFGPNKFRKYLINSDEMGNDYYKLHLFGEDGKYLYELIDAIINEHTLPQSNSKLYFNYIYLKKQLESTNIQKIWEGLQNTSLIYCQLGNKNNPYQLFYTLNKYQKGVDLKLSDDLWVKIFEKTDFNEKISEEYRVKYWNPMLKHFNNEYLGQTKKIPLFNYFIQFFLTTYLMKQIPTSDISNKFQQILDHENDLKNLLITICNESRKFTDLYFMKTSYHFINEHMKFFRMCGIGIWYLLYNCYSDFLEDKINEKDLDYILRYMKIGLIRVKAANELNSIYNIQKAFKAYSEINEKGYIYSFVQSFSKYFHLPSDEKIRYSLLELPFYSKFKSKMCNYVFEEMENYGNDEILKGCTVEHIMPKTLTSQWKRHLGDTYDEVHHKYKHNLGNLIPLSSKLNSKGGNSTFKAKKEFIYSESKFKLTQKICEFEKWGENEIIAHRNFMIEKFLETFKIPKYDFY